MLVDTRQRLDVLHKALGIFIEDDTRIENILRVEELLDFLHDAIGLVAPLLAHKGRHVAASAMLGLERAVVLVDHELHRFTHKFLVALHIFVGLKRLAYHKVEISLQGMAVDAAIGIAMLVEHACKIDRCIGKVLNVEGNVLDNHCSAYGASACNDGENARPYLPVLAILGRVAGEASRHMQLVVAHDIHDLGDILVECVLVVGRGAHQYGRESLARLVLGCRERLLVEHLGTLHRTVLELHDALAGLAHVVEVEHGAGRVAVEMACGHGKLAGKAQSTLAAHHAMRDDVERVGEPDKGQKVQPRHVLDLILVLDAFHQLGVGHNLIAQLLDALHKVGTLGLECCTAAGVARVEHSAVGHDDAHRLQYLVAVGMCATAHARGIVDDNTAHHGRVF